MESEPRWLLELYRIGAIRKTFADSRTALFVSVLMLAVSVLADDVAIRIGALSVGFGFCAGAAGALSALIEKIDRDTDDD